MTEESRAHPDIPEDAIEVKSKSNFGSQVGYVHYIRESLEQEDVYYLGLNLEEKHAGAPGRGHGAVSMAMLDEVMGRAASRRMNMLCYTVSMTTNFCSGSRVGEFMLASATVARCGKSLVFVDAQLHAGDRLVATATGTWTSSGLPIPVR